jgi:hypothetical protein
MKRYYGEPALGGYGATVLVIHDEDIRTVLRHHVHHSPDGFAWGYGGSGPSELARCILRDLLGEFQTPHVYHRFKDKFITPAPKDQPLSIHEADIRAWLAQERQA